MNQMTNTLDKQYTDLLQTILDYGVEKKDRTGTGTKSIFGYTIRHNMKHGFPLLTTKKMAWKTMVTELLWFLRGDTNIKYLVDNNCHIWDGDAYKAYLKKYEKDKLHGVIYENDETQNRPFSKEEFINWIKNNDKFSELYGELGPVYGKQWRSWAINLINPNTMELVPPIDQIQNLINELKTNPDSRRLMVSAWNVGEIDQMVLPPCHYGFQVYTRELSAQERLDWVKTNLPNVEVNGFVTDDEYSHKWVETLDDNIPTRAISLMFNMRSVDTLLGLPFNIASYGLLLTMIADEVNMVPDELIGNLGDTHLYLNHIEQAKEQIGRDLTLEERRAMVTQEMFNQIYTGGSPESLSHSEIDQWDIPKRTREPYPLPKVSVRDGIHCSSVNDVILENYKSHPAIKAPLSN
jgi:thymidylate synthase